MKSKQQKNDVKNRELTDRGIFINYVHPILYKGLMVWAIGDRVYYKRPPNETFHEFIIFILKDTLGQRWFDEQKMLFENDQHHIYKCFAGFNKWRGKNALPENKIGEHMWRGRPDGWSEDLITLAFDVASLQHTGCLPVKLVERLRDRKQYQGARYEIEVAAIFTRLGFDITFIEAKRNGPKHCEFIAKNRANDLTVAIEVKSRHRAGILHESGLINDKKNLRGDVGRLLNQAMEKIEARCMSYIIFVDVNIPPTENDRGEFGKKMDEGC